MNKRLFIISFIGLVLSGCARQEEASRGLPWWGWLILIAALVLVVYLIARGQPKEEPTIKSMARRIEPQRETEIISEPEIEEVSEPIIDTVLEPEPDFIPETQIPDNLTLIEGIGPKIQSILHEAGVKSFAQLAEMAPIAIKELLTNAGLRLGVTDTWPEQARLAAEGKMDELEALQNRLTGGREG